MPLDPLTSSLISGGFNLLGGVLGNQGFEQARSDIGDLTQFNPFSASTGGGTFSFTQGGLGSFNEDAQTQAIRQAIGSQIAPGLAGGLFNDPGLAAAFQGNDILGALNQSVASTQGLPQAFAASQLGGVNALGGSLLGQALAGPQDFTGGLQGSLFNQGFANQLAAGDFAGTQASELAALRAAAAPEQNRQFNRLQDRLFAMGQLGSTGGGEQLRGLMEAQGQQDLNFQTEAFNRALGRGQFLGGLGSQQIGQGAGLLGQNLGQFNQGVANARGMLGLGAGLENQFFQNQLAAAGQGMSAGQQRLSNALNLFGVGQGAQAQGFQQGLQGQAALQGMNQFGLSGILGLLNAEANRIGATGQHAQALGQVGQNQGGFLGSLLGGIGDLF